MRRPSSVKFSPQLVRRLEPNGLDPRMTPRIDRTGAPQEGHGVAEFRRRSGDFGPHPP